jgi:glycosyltransferase involved in cell wall biosynthesis
MNRQDASLRVLIINTLYPPNLYGGAETSVELLARGLARRGHQPTVLSLGPAGAASETFTHGVRAIFVPLRNLYNPWQPGKPQTMSGKLAWHMIDMANPAMALTVRRTIAAIRPDIVHTNNLSGFSTLAWTEARRAGVPVAHTLRDYWLLCPLATMFRDGHQCAVICRRCRLASALRRRHSAVPLGVAGVSQHILNVHTEAGYFPNAALQQRIINPIGEPGAGFTPHVRDRAKPVRLGYMGALHPSKGIGRLIDALQAIPRGGWHLVVAGRGDPDYVAALRQRAAALPVDFIGFVEPDVFYSTVDIVIIPSIWDDPMPRIVLEAFTRGLPVIASRRGGIGELVTHGQTGYLFDPMQAGELEAALVQGLANADGLAQVGADGRRRVAALGLTEVAASYAAFYHATLRRQRPAGRGMITGAQAVRPLPPAGTATPQAGPGTPHVVLINHLYQPDVLGGAEIMVEGLARQLRARGWRVSIITTGSSDSRIAVDGITIHRLRVPNIYWLKDVRPRSLAAKLTWRLVNLWNPLLRSTLTRLLRELAPDVVHTHNIVSFSPIIWAAAKELGLPLIHTAHDYYLLCPNWSMTSRTGRLCTQPSPACRLYRAWHLRQAARLDVFCAPSQFLLRQHQTLLARSTRKLHLPNGIALQPAPGIEPEPPVAAPVRFLLLGQLLLSKGVAVVLAAMRAIPADATLELHVAGCGVLEQDVRAAAAADPRIRYHGFVSGAAKASLIASAQVLLYPSLWYENGPYALMEAAAAGLAVLGSDIGAIPEFVEDGVNGQLFPCGDAAALAQRMMALMHAPARLAALRRGARARAAAYGEGRMVDAYIGEYRRLMHQAGALRTELLGDA